MKNGRLFEILYLLVEKRAVTAGELAEKLEVSERTIYRDVDALSAAGIPVYAQKGKGGGIRLMDQFVLDRALLSGEQQDEILFALQAIRATGGGEEALSRLSALFRREGGDWLEVDFSDWGSGAAERENFSKVKRSILERRPLSFTYYSSAGETSRRTAEPARLVFKAGCWYLSAFCQERQGWCGWRTWSWRRGAAHHVGPRSSWRPPCPGTTGGWTCGCCLPPPSRGGCGTTSTPKRCPSSPTDVCWWRVPSRRTNGCCPFCCPSADSWRCCRRTTGGIF